MRSLTEALPFIGMIAAECAQVALIIISKEIISNGMNNFIFVFYCNAIASLVLLPASLFAHFNRSERPALTFSILCGFFLLGLLGCLAQVFGYAGIQNSSPTLATAMLNLIPGFTFMLAVASRMEIIDWGSSSSLAKFIGTVVSIAGAFVVTLYQGPRLFTTAPSRSTRPQLLLQPSNWVIRGLLLIADCVLASAWLIVQALILKRYSMQLTVVLFYFFFAAIQSAIISLVFERDPSSWILTPNSRLIGVLCSAVLGYAFPVGVATWCLHKTGPVFVAMFKPLGIVITVSIGVIFQGDTFYLGSLLGSILIIVGFYSVMWGKAKEGTLRDTVNLQSMDVAGQKVPLLKTIEA